MRLDSCLLVIMVVLLVALLVYAMRRINLRQYLPHLLLAVVLLWPLCTGHSLYWGDILLYFVPMWRVAQESLSHGIIPLWNPLLLGGQPLVGNPQEGIFYPGTLLLPFLPVWGYMNLMLVLHLFASGAFTCLFLRRWTSRAPASTVQVGPLLGGMVYMGSGYLIGRIQFPPMIFTAAYLPLMLYCLDRSIDAFTAYYENRSCQTYFYDCVHNSIRNRNQNEHEGSDRFVGLLVPLLLLSVVSGLMTLAAHPQMAYLILILATSYGIGRLSSFYGASRALPNWRSRSVRIALALIVATLLGWMLASVQLVPAIQLLMESTREKLTATQVNRFYMEPGRLLTFVLPNFFGHPSSGNHWGLGNAWEPAVFTGWLPVALATGVCVRFWRRRFVQFWSITAIMGIWLAAGNAGGLFLLAYHIVPGVSNFHDPARFLLFPTFSLAVLTSVGWESGEQFLKDRCHLSRTRSHMLTLLGVTGTATPLVIFGLPWNPTASPGLLDVHPSRRALIASSGPSGFANRPVGRMLVPVHDTLWKHLITDGYSDYATIRPDALQSYVNSMLPNIGMTDGIVSASGYEPVPIAASALIEKAMATSIHQGQPTAESLLFLMGVGTCVVPSTYRITDPALIPLRHNSNLPVTIFQPRRQPEEAWIVHRVHHIEGVARAMAAISAPGFHSDEEAIVSNNQNVPISSEMLRTDEGLNNGINNGLHNGINNGIDKANGNLLTQRPKQDLVVRTSPNRGTLGDQRDQRYHVFSANRPGLLVFCQTGYPGWKAGIDGRRSPVYRVDGVLMGIFVPAGEHEVRLFYKPESYLVGLYLSIFAALLISAGVVFVSVNRAVVRRQRAQEPGGEPVCQIGQVGTESSG